MMKKPLLHHYLLQVKRKISIGNAKIETLKTWPYSKIILDQGYVFGNTNSRPLWLCEIQRKSTFFVATKRHYKEGVPVCLSVTLLLLLFGLLGATYVSGRVSGSVRFRANYKRVCPKGWSFCRFFVKFSKKRPSKCHELRQHAIIPSYMTHHQPYGPCFKKRLA